MVRPKATANPPAPMKTSAKASAPRKSRAKPKTTASERSSSLPGAPQKDDSDQSDIEVISRKQPRQVVNWIQNPGWTSSLITYLTDDPPFRIRLFSDSTADAKQQGRAKFVGKDGKQQQYAVLAAYVFSDDPKEQARYANNPGKYATAVETRFRRLKKEYKYYVDMLGATGAGLLPDQVIPGSKIENLLGDIQEKWPWWEDLHPFWRELPNYNPVGVQSSEPGTDHATDAQSLFDSSGRAPSIDEDEDDDGRSATSRARETKVDDDGGDYQSHESDPDNKEDETELERNMPSPEPPRRASSFSPPATVSVSVKSVPKQNSKTKTVGGGRDLGLAKANSTLKSAAKPKVVSALDRMNDLRAAESERMSQKRKMQHEEEMARIRIKKAKIELKLLQAQNERKRLNRSAMTSPTTSRRTRVLNLSPNSPARHSRSYRMDSTATYHPSPSIDHSPAHTLPSFSAIGSMPDEFDWSTPIHTQSDNASWDIVPGPSAASGSESGELSLWSFTDTGAEMTAGAPGC